MPKIADSKKRILEYVALALILVLATVLGCYRIAEPAWHIPPMNLCGGIDPGWSSFLLCEWGAIARNYLRFDYPEADLRQVEYAFSWGKFNRFHLRVDHPPLLPLLISLSYRLFGIHEWSTRLVPLLASLGLLPLVFWLGCELGDKKIALIASFFFALLPVRAYYSALPAPQILGAFFSWLTIISYLRWVETRSAKWCAAVYFGFILAALSDWISYFVVPPLLIHYMVCESRKTKSLKFALSFGILPVMLLSVHFAWVYLLAGKEGIWKLLDRFLVRTISGGSEEGVCVFTVWDFYAAVYARLRFFLTPTICILSVVWLISFLTMPFHKKLTKRSMCIAIFFLFCLGPNLVFQNRVYVHDFIMLIDFTPLFAILAALGVRFVAEKVLLDRRVLIVPLYLIVCYLLATQATVALRRLYNGVRVDADSFLVGNKVNEITDGNAKVMGSFESDPRNYVMRFYADRPWSRVGSLQDLISLLQADPSYSHYAFDNREPPDRELQEYLVRNHPVESFYSYSFFDLRESGSNTILENPQIEHPTEVNFGDQLMFLGYEVEEAVQKKPGPSWLEKYFKGRPEFLPEHRTFFRITYFWRCLKDMEKDYTLVTQFEGRYGKTYRIDQSHQGVNGAYPTSMWRVGEVIREEYQVEVPAEYPPIRYTLWVGVGEGGEELPVMGEVEADEGGRVRVGEVEVLPAQKPTPLTAAPHPQNRVEMNINDDLMFLGYDLGKRNPKPGDRLRVITYWRSLKETGGDYTIQVELRGGEYKVREVLDLGPTRLWEGGGYYRGEVVVPVHPYLLGGAYSLNLVWEGEDGAGGQVSLVSWEISQERRHILRRVGKANYGGDKVLRPGEPLRVRFNLREREAVEVVAGWTGRAEGEETRVEVYISQPYRSERYVGTWVVASGAYRTTKWKISKVLTAPGENVVELRVAEVRERVHNVGWRGWVDRVFPDLLQDPSTDYDGPIQMDFVQVSGEWEGDWDDYYDLAKVYADREMMGEVARLYEEAVEEGVEPERVDDLALFKAAYRALGEEGKVKEVEEWIGGRIGHKVEVNLGGKVEFLGYSLRGDHGLSLFFRCEEEMGEDYTLWVHGEVEDESLLEGQRREAGYAVFDHLLSTSGWQVGEVYQDDEVKGLRPGRYHFTLGLWKPEDGSRLWRKDNPEEHVIDLGWVEAR